MRSPFRAKHHVVMQYMAAGPKCPLPPPQPPPSQNPPRPDPPPAEDSIAGGGQGGPGRIDKQGRIDDINATAVALSTASRFHSAVIKVFYSHLVDRDDKNLQTFFCSILRNRFKMTKERTELSGLPQFCATKS